MQNPPPLGLMSGTRALDGGCYEKKDTADTILCI
jgi:hypothetical protein